MQLPDSKPKLLCSLGGGRLSATVSVCQRRDLPRLPCFCASPGLAKDPCQGVSHQGGSIQPTLSSVGGHLSNLLTGGSPRFAAGRESAEKAPSKGVAVPLAGLPKESVAVSQTDRPTWYVRSQPSLRANRQRSLSLLGPTEKGGTQRQRPSQYGGQASSACRYPQPASRGLSVEVIFDAPRR